VNVPARRADHRRRSAQEVEARLRIQLPAAWMARSRKKSPRLIPPVQRLVCFIGGNHRIAGGEEVFGRLLDWPSEGSNIAAIDFGGASPPSMMTFDRRRAEGPSFFKSGARVRIGIVWGVGGRWRRRDDKDGLLGVVKDKEESCEEGLRRLGIGKREEEFVREEGGVEGLRESEGRAMGYGKGRWEFLARIRLCPQGQIGNRAQRAGRRTAAPDHGHQRPASPCHGAFGPRPNRHHENFKRCADELNRPWPHLLHPVQTDNRGGPAPLIPSADVEAGIGPGRGGGEEPERIHGAFRAPAILFRPAGLIAIGAAPRLALVGGGRPAMAERGGGKKRKNETYLRLPDAPWRWPPPHPEYRPSPKRGRLGVVINAARAADLRRAGQSEKRSIARWD